MKTGLRNFTNKFIFLLILFVVNSIQAQVHINGFCSYSSIDIQPGYTSLLPLNFNNDAYTDFFIYNNGNKNAFSVSGNVNGELSLNKKINFKYNITAIRNLSFGNYYSGVHVFVSRKSRTAGLINFRGDGQPNLFSEYKFDSYPENLDVSDVQSDAAPEVLISGPSFDGLSLLNIRQGRITENKILKGTPFRDACFIDFTNDNVDDIVAVNIYTASIDFFTNDSRGRFSYTRSLKLQALPFFLECRDIDLDGYEDIVWGEENGNINICYGDAVSGYTDTRNLKTEDKPYVLVTGDYNSDGLIDIVYADTAAGRVAAILSSEARVFSEEITLFNKQGIKSIVPYYSKFINGIAAIVNSGRIYVADKINSFSEELNLISGSRPGAINYFDNRNDGITDICYIDEDESSLNFITRNSGGIPEYYFRQKLHFPHKQIFVDEISSGRKAFYCWSEGEKLIEVITVDFSNKEFSRNSLYATGRIEDLTIKPNDNSPAAIYVSYIKNGNAGANVFEYHDFRYRRADYSGFALNVNNIATFVRANEPGFFTWQKRENLELYLHSLRKLGSQKLVGKITEGEIAFSISADIFNDDYPTQLAYLKPGRLIISNNEVNVIPVPDSLQILSRNNFWFGAVDPSGMKQLFYYNTGRKTLNLVTLFNERKNLILSEMISGIIVNRYFIRNMSQQDYHIVYTDPEENCITIQRIK